MLLFPHTSPLRVPEVLFWVNHILNISQNTDLFLTPSGFQSSIYFTASIWSTVPCPSMNSVSVLVSCLWALWQALSNVTVLEAFMSHPQCCWPLNQGAVLSQPECHISYPITSGFGSFKVYFPFFFMVCSFSVNLQVPKLPQNKNLHFLSHKHILNNLIAPAVRTKDKGSRKATWNTGVRTVQETQLQQHLHNHMEVGVIHCTEGVTNHRDFKRSQQIRNELFGAYKFQEEVCYGTHIEMSSFQVYIVVIRGAIVRKVCDT